MLTPVVNEETERRTMLSKRLKGVMLGLLLLLGAAVAVVNGRESSWSAKPGSDVAKSIHLKSGSSVVMHGDGTVTGDVPKTELSIAQDAVYRIVAQKPTCPWTTQVPTTTSTGQTFELYAQGRKIEEICVYFNTFVEGLKLKFAPQVAGGQSTEQTAGKTTGSVSYHCVGVQGCECFKNVGMTHGPWVNPRAFAGMRLGFKYSSGSYALGNQQMSAHLYDVSSERSCLFGIRGGFTNGELSEISFKYC